MSINKNKLKKGAKSTSTKPILKAEDAFIKTVSNKENLSPIDKLATLLKERESLEVDLRVLSNEFNRGKKLHQALTDKIRLTLKEIQISVE